MHKLKSKYIKLNEKTRLYSCSMPIIGLTGGIASGKSMTCDFLKKTGIRVISADLLVKEIYKLETSLELLKSIAPATIQKNKIDFISLREIFFTDENVKLTIEKHIYQELPGIFLKEKNKDAKQKSDFLVYEIPLLFEKGLQDKLDLTICIHTSLEIQRKRIKARDGSSKAISDKIIKSQMDTFKKISLSDFSIDNSKDLKITQSKIKLLINSLTE